MITLDEWFQKICDSYSRPPVYVEGVGELPGFPPDAMQITTTGQAGIDTLKDAFVFYQDCTKLFRQLGRPMESQHSLLDFGAGWGRITRFFLRDLPLGNIFGIDVTEESVEICKKTFRSDQFYVCNPFPPASFPDGKISYVVGYSVFSHLSEQACASWMREFHRILAPDGFIALTTRGRPFLDYCESLQAQKHSGYLGALSSMFDDFSLARARYDGGEFVHSNSVGVTGGGAMTGEFYGESFIPESYARTAYAELFTLEKFLVGHLPQTPPTMFFRKK
jgi:SAM-dependent methyltransferase